MKKNRGKERKVRFKKGVRERKRKRIEGKRVQERLEKGKNAWKGQRRRV